MAEARECFICGDHRPNSIESHHVVPRRFGGSDAPENLVNLCSSCHSAIEKLYNDSFYERIGVEETDVGNSTNIDTTGTKIPPYESEDRTFPPKATHVNVEKFGLVLTLPQMILHPPGELIRDDFPESDLLIEKLNEIDIETLRERDRDITSGRLMSVFPEDDRLTPPVKIVRARETDEYTATSTNPLHSGWFTRYHCGYCHSVYSEDEQADLAAHLRVKHRIEDPYHGESMGMDFPL